MISIILSYLLIYNKYIDNFNRSISFNQPLVSFILPFILFRGKEYNYRYLNKFHYHGIYDNNDIFVDHLIPNYQTIKSYII